MIAADRPGGRPARLLVVTADGHLRHMARTALATLFNAGDLVIANDAATLPASLAGTHCPSGERIEVRLAAWVSVHEPTRFDAIAFGAGDYRTRTEQRMPAPPLVPGDRLALGPLVGVVEHLLDAPRLFRLRFLGNRPAVLAGFARHGRPIQYAHVRRPLALSDVWTAIAADPLALEPPSDGFALDWRTQAVWRQRGVGFATLTHAAGISSTGDATLDRRLPFDEPFCIPKETAAAIAQVKSQGGRIVAIGTTVVRALESAATPHGRVYAGSGVAVGRILPQSPIRVVDAVLSGVHEPSDSHFELLRAFRNDTDLDEITAALQAYRYRAHEFGDSVLMERCYSRASLLHQGPPSRNS